MSDDARAIREAFGSLEALGPSARRAVTEAVRARIRAETLGVVIEALASPEARARAVALEALRGREDLAPCVGPLIALLGGDAAAQRRAARALGELGDARALPPLSWAVLNADDEGAREAAAEALGRLDEPRAVGPLIEASERGRWRTRRAAARALGVSGDLRAALPLARLAGCDKAKVRRVAEAALERLREAHGLEALVEALLEDVEDLRLGLWAVSGLERLGGACVDAGLVEIATRGAWIAQRAAARARAS